MEIYQFASSKVIQLARPGRDWRRFLRRYRETGTPAACIENLLLAIEHDGRARRLAKAGDPRKLAERLGRLGLVATSDLVAEALRGRP